MSTQNKNRIRVGVAGLGRSGWNIHVKALSELPDLFEVAAVSDPDAQRRAEAEQAHGCRSYDQSEALFADDALDLVVVATPSQLHAEHSITALKAGRHVVCEKPFALSPQEADKVIAAAEQAGRMIAPFQNRRFEPVFVKLREIIDSGILGRIVQAKITIHKFGRRWDWQTLQRFGGGELNNTGPHFMDQALEIFGEGEPEVFSYLDRALTCGDADDHVKVILHGEGHPLVDVEITSAGVFRQDMWLVMGTRGGLRVSGGRVEWKWVDEDQLPPREVEIQPTADRTYNRETLTWNEASWDPEAEPTEPMNHQFYRNVHARVTRNEPLVVTPQSVRRQIAVLKRCHELCPLSTAVGV